MAVDLDGIKLSELVTFERVARLRSLSAAARELGVTPSQVSKSLGKLEKRLQAVLLDRSGRGTSLTESGRMLLPKIQELSHILSGLQRPAGIEVDTVTLGAPSYLASTLVPKLVERAPSLRFRVQEQSAAMLRASLPEHVFDFGLLFGTVDRAPAGWVAEAVGEIRNGLFARPEFARKIARKMATVEAVAECTFVMPLRNSSVAVSPSDDGCPIPLASRKVGTEVQTFAVGLEVATHTNQVVYGHVLAAQRFLDSGLLQEIPVRGWDHRDTVVLLASDRVLARVAKVVRSELFELLK
jgi:DNA-binding transcriptional LysR family regulator